MPGQEPCKLERGLCGLHEAGEGHCVLARINAPRLPTIGLCGLTQVQPMLTHKLGLDDLPKDELLNVLEHLGTPDLQALRRTNQHFSIVVRGLRSEWFESKDAVMAAPVLTQRFPDFLEVLRQLPESAPAGLSMRVLHASPGGSSLIQ